MHQSILVETYGRSIVIRFNRPEIRNPLSIDVLARLTDMLHGLSSRDDIASVIFTGVGEVFASGADLREIAGVDPASAAAFARRGQNAMMLISELAVPTIAAVNGICFGGALDLALSCKHRFASHDALFAHPGADLGIMTGWGGTQRLPRLIGEGRALEMFFTAKRVTADEALAIGLVDRVVTDPLRSALDFDGK